MPVETRMVSGSRIEGPEPKSRITKWLVGVAGVVTLSGLLFGYDQGGIGGALDGIERSFHPSTLVIEIITSWVTLGALVGALIAGNLADRLGRRQTTSESNSPSDAGVIMLVAMVTF
ncbi:MAG: MFS transporter, partial [Mycobacteriaceae bacterium]